MRRILLALVAAIAFATTVGVSPISSSTAEARPWVRARVGVGGYGRPYYRTYYRPYYRTYYRPYSYGGYGYNRPYYSGRYYYNW
jgi:hypothetical protein